MSIAWCYVPVYFVRVLWVSLGFSPLAFAGFSILHFLFRSFSGGGDPRAQVRSFLERLRVDRKLLFKGNPVLVAYRHTGIHGVTICDCTAEGFCSLRMERNKISTDQLLSLPPRRWYMYVRYRTVQYVLGHGLLPRTSRTRR